MILPEPDDAFKDELAGHTRPANYAAPTPKSRYDLVVIGAGPAGLVCAAGAVAVGASVALVERYRLGGDCLHFGCVPSKALIRSGRAAAAVRNAPDFGIETSPPVINDSRVMERLRRVRAGISHVDRVERFRAMGIDVFFGDAAFAESTSIQVAGLQLKFMRAIIATGSRAAALDVPSLRPGDFFTNETIFNLTTLPRRLLVIGGGPIGCELSQAFARLGCQVQLVHRGPRILPREEPEAAAIVARRMAHNGVALHLGARVIDAGRHFVEFETQGRRTRLEGDALLVAVGRRPNVENLNLAAGGIDVNDEGVVVNDRLHTSNSRVFAAGDVCSTTRFTHAADAMARLTVRNALFFGRARWSQVVIPRCTYTDPEVASVGLTANEARERGIAIDTLTVPMNDVDRAILDGETEGFATIHLRRGSERIVGATLVATHAGEMIGEIVQAMTHGVGLGKLAAVVRPYPTQAEVWKKLADAYQRSRFTPRVARLLRGVLWLRRRFG